MTDKMAARLLDPETRDEEMRDIELQVGTGGETIARAAFDTACRMGAKALRKLRSAEKMEYKITELLARAEKAEKKLEEAVSDLKRFGQCGACKNYYKENACGAGPHSYCDGGFVWRGAEGGMSMKRYRKKPVTIEAVQWTGNNISEICKFTGRDVAHLLVEGQFYIQTLEGTHHASIGDYIIKGVYGEFYPCKPDIFKETYEEVKEGE